MKFNENSTVWLRFFIKAELQIKMLMWLIRSLLNAAGINLSVRIELIVKENNSSFVDLSLLENVWRGDWRPCDWINTNVQLNSRR